MSVVNKDMNLGFSNEKTRIFLTWIGSGKKVLDVGCYDGRDTLKFVQAGNEVHGIEVLEEPAKKAKSLGVNVAVFDMDKEKSWPYADNFFDVVVAGDIIEHVIDVDKFLANAHRVLKPGGYFLVSTPNLASLGRRLLLLFGKNPFIEISWRDKINGAPSVGHVRYFTMESLHRTLTMSGFAVEKITSDMFNFGPFKSTAIGKLAPGFSWRLIVKAKKS